MFDPQEIAKEVTAKIREELAKIKIVDFGEVKTVTKLANGGYTAKVLIAGATSNTTDLSCLAHYVPTVGEWVMIVYPRGSSGVIIGEAPAKENTIEPNTHIGPELRIRNAGSAKLVVEADSDNVNEEDVASVELLQDGGATWARMGLDSLNRPFLQAGSNAPEWQYRTADGLAYYRFHHDGQGKHFPHFGGYQYGQSGDLNFLTTEGYFHVTNTFLNLPEALYGHVWVWVHNNDYIVQEFQSSSNNTRRWQRMKTGGVWTTWQRFVLRPSGVGHYDKVFEHVLYDEGLFSTTSATWQTLSFLYGPLGYSAPAPQTGATRKYKLRMRTSNNCQGAATYCPRVRIINDAGNTNIISEIQMGNVWGAVDGNWMSSWQSGYVDGLTGNTHGMLQMRVCDTNGNNLSGFTVVVRQVVLEVYDYFP